MAIPGVFYVIVLLGGFSLDSAREYGWLVDDVATKPAGLSDLTRLYDFSLVQWDVWPNLWHTWLSMVCVVAFSSCLDVAAIEMDVRNRDRRSKINKLKPTDPKSGAQRIKRYFSKKAGQSSFHGNPTHSNTRARAHTHTQTHTSRI